MGNKNFILFDLIKKSQKFDRYSKYIVFVGAGASFSSGLSLFSKIFKSLKVKNHDELSAIFDSLSDNERFSLLKSHLEYTIISQSALKFASLVKEGFFDIIVTTNFDNLIEQSLNEVGLSHNDYEVLINFLDMPITDLDKIIQRTPPRIKIIKLHGDFLQRKFAITIEETLSFSNSIERELKRLFRLNDVLVIGSKFTDLDLLRIIEPDGGALWYINPSPPESFFKAILKKRNCQNNIITGSEGRHGDFFNHLSEYLMDRKESIDTYQGMWYLIAPFSTMTPLEGITNLEIIYSENIDNGKLIRLKGLENTELYWFDYGIAVWVIKIPIKYRYIYEYAIERRRIYKEILEGNHQICGIVSEVNNDHKYSSQIGYCFSYVDIYKPIWKQKELDTALKLFSYPTIFHNKHLEDENLLNLEESIFNELILEDIDIKNYDCFNVTGSHIGYSTWSGLSTYFIANKRKTTASDVLKFEIKLQSYWWYLAHMKSLIISGEDNFVSVKYHKEDIIKKLSKLLEIEPTETTVYRLYKESIIQTSRIKNQIKDFKELL